MIKTLRKLILSGVFISGVLSACSDRAVVDRFELIPDRSWEYAFQPEFELNVADNNVGYRVFVNFRHSNQYTYSNIYLLLHHKSPDGDVKTERVELPLAEPDGRWLGKNSGNIYTHRFLVSENYSFTDTGTHKLSIEQNMRENPLQHVLAAGLRIEPVE